VRSAFLSTRRKTSG
ncbi:glucose-6-phosphate dehydrogenase, partial [Chlamydia psittaci 08DC60]